VLVFGFLGGQLSDQFSRKKVLLVCEASMLAGAAFLSWMIFSGAATTSWVLGFSALHGLGTALSVSARQTLTADSAPPGQERGAIGLGILVANLSGIIGPTIAGNVIGSGGVALALAISVGLGAAALPFYARMALDRRGAPGRPAGSRWRSVGQGVKHATRDPLLRWLMLTAFITLTMLSSRGAVYPAIVVDVLHLGASAFALIEVTGGIGATLGPLAAVALSSRFSERRVELWSGLVFAVTVLLMAISNSLWMAALMSGLTTFTGTIFFAANLSGIQLGAPPELRGRVIAARFALSGTHPLGMMALGGVAEFIGPQWALGMFALAGFAIFALVSALWMPRGDSNVDGAAP
jgi:MFS family permease